MSEVNSIIKKAYKRLLPIILLNLVYTYTMAQDVTLKASLGNDTIFIGDQVELKIEVEHLVGFDVLFPIHQDTLTVNIGIINVLPIDSVEGERGRMKRVQKYIITSFDSGSFTIPPLQFIINSKEGIDTIYTSSLDLTVNTLPVNLDEPIKDIKDIYGAPITFRELLPFLLAVIAGALVVYAVYYIIKKIKRKEPILARFVKPKEPAEVIALRELDKLKAMKLWQQGRVKEYYSLLTEILRIYTEKRFAIMAMEQTSDEILEQFERTDYGDKDEYKMLRQLLILADLVKFAKGVPLADENEKHLSNAYTFVINTTPQSPGAEEGETMEESNTENINKAETL